MDLGWDWILFTVADFDLIKADEMAEKYTLSELAMVFTAMAARNAYRFKDR